MIWENEQAIIEELLYWQKRALKAEKKLKKVDEVIEVPLGFEEEDLFKYRS